MILALETVSKVNQLSDYFTAAFSAIIGQVLISDEASAEVKTVRRSKIAVVEDDVFLQDAWRRAGNEFVIVFSNPVDFALWLAQDKNNGRSLSAVVTDMYFEGTPDVTGLDVLTSMKKIRLRLPTYLASDAYMQNDDAAAYGFTARISKDPYEGMRFLKTA